MRCFFKSAAYYTVTFPPVFMKMRQGERIYTFLTLILITIHYSNYYSQANDSSLRLIDDFLTRAHTLSSVKQSK
ncbi:Uncharacterised protein [Citrobacter koseri]|uniref:Uncharacterized protein n=1 Tax=Citrobacter koseri TaxID=545 RepID=A0A2X2WHH7_CITKO|nr:Uncharacterised protein [Citrobacter koseri]